MKKNAFITLSIITISNFTLALANDELYEKSLDELLNLELEQRVEIGSREGARDLSDTEVPIDVISAKEIQKSGYKELTKILQKFIPSFNSPRPSITDGSDHIQAFTLRGLNPDQVLVLINGKRVHSTALMHINGSIGRGSTGVDLNTIPISMIERVEILRDGAAAQYGSDAIAGVINIVLKESGYQNEFVTTLGETKEGDGDFFQSGIFYSIPLKYDGFFNISLEARDRDATNRAGVDKRAQYPSGDIRNELASKVNMHYGEADTEDFTLAINTKAPSESGNIYYLRALLNKRESMAGAYIRRAVDNRNNMEIYPNGFVPKIAPKIEDYSINAGIKGFTSNDIEWDLSNTIGYNEMRYYVRDSLNNSLGLESPTSFYAGELNYLQNSLNLDLSKKVDKLNIAGGLEARYENFEIGSGEETSYMRGSFSDIAGSQGFPGFRKENEVSKSRSNYASYLDLKYQMSEKFLINGATRFEYYTDFGSTLDAKIALSHKTTNTLLVRGSASTGFRAPSLSQSHFSATTTNFVGNTLYETGTFGVEHPLAQILGAKDLTPEESKHLTFGFVYKPMLNLTLTMDYFYTRIDDRIILSENIDGSISNEVKTIFESYKIGKARFFTNAISTELNGIDFRLNYNYEFENNSKLNLGIWFNYAKNEILSVNNPPEILGANGDNIVIGYPTRVTIEEGQPKSALKILTNYETHKWDIALTLSRYGSFKDTFETSKVYSFDAKWVSDLDISYKINDKFNIAIGAENLFDVYPDKWGNTKSDIFGTGSILEYSKYSPFGFNGAFYYFRAKVIF